jgi:uncharacterized glyoxalase superfamily protein PhnB
MVAEAGPRSPYAQPFGAGEVGERFTGPGAGLVHAETRIGDSAVMITEDAVDGPGRPAGRLGGMISCVMALSWEDVDATTPTASCPNGVGIGGAIP